ncbi:MAG: hypothetical protein GC151_00175 [Betaproteobacteria bacterium]|nr:hypothetical protein [Betaproteobacteria bacterium]
MHDPSLPALTLLFTGHMVDTPGRASPRFPRSPAAETTARRMIADAVARETASLRGDAIGLAAAASGGDILFHEVCRERDVATRILLPLPVAEFREASVAPGGPDWSGRFDRLCRDTPPEILPADQADALAGTASRDMSIWQLGNLWLLESALALGARRLTLIALWDGAEGDGPGGTADLVERAEARGCRCVILPAERLLSVR